MHSKAVLMALGSQQQTSSDSLGLYHLYGLSLITERINNHVDSKVRTEITFQTSRAVCFGMDKKFHPHVTMV